MYKILIVDDEKIERNGIRFLLKKMGAELEVSEAANGKAALEYMEEKRAAGEKIDILLTDVKMPFMDGIELVRAVKEAGFESKNIIFSGYNEFEYAKLAVKLGVVDYILKPVDPKEFGATLNKVLGEIDQQKQESVQKEKINGFIKEYTLYSLFNGRQASAVENKEFWNEYNRIFLLEFNNEFFGKEVTDFDVEVLEEGDLIGRHQYLNLNQQQAVILLNDGDDLMKKAELIVQKVSDKYGCGCYIAVSKLVNDYSEIPQVMDYLDVLMENKFYHPDMHIFTGQKDESAPELVQTDDDTLMKLMKQDMKMKDITGLREHFDRLSSKYHNQSCFSHIYTKFIFSNILKDLFAVLPEPSEEQFNKEVERLYSSDDLDGIIEIINGHIDQMEEAFKKNPQTTHREIDTVKQYIYKHYGEEIGVDQLADMVYLTPSYLSSIFKKETGQNLSKFIKQYRMEQAREELRNTNKKIVNISNETGYPNVSYFCQSFREYFGMSPQKFREDSAYDS